MVSLLGPVVVVLALAGPGQPPPAEPLPLRKGERVPEPPAELVRELDELDKKYRHGTPEQFAELEARAKALAERFADPDDRARVWAQVAHVGGQSRIDKHIGLVRRYAQKCLAFCRDPRTRARMDSLLASAAEVGGGDFPARRREAAGYLLAGYRELLAQDLPDRAPELPGVDPPGDIGRGGAEDDLALARYYGQRAARAAAEHVRELVQARDTLVLQLRDLYKPNPKYRGRTPEGPEELRALAGRSLTGPQVREMLRRVLEENGPGR